MTIPRLAITRAVPASLAACELTLRARTPIDLAGARREHAAYEEALRSLGLIVEQLPSPDESADAVFIEDTACVLDELAVIARLGAASRRDEVDAVARKSRK